MTPARAGRYRLEVSSQLDALEPLISYPSYAEKSSSTANLDQRLDQQPNDLMPTLEQRKEEPPD